MVTISLYNLVNTFWVARLGYQAIAALTIVLPLFIVCMAVGVGTGIGVNALTSRYFGERNVEAANQVAGQTFFLSLVIGLLVLLVTNIFPHQILLLCGATPDIMELGEQYLRMLGWAMPTLFFGLITRNVFHASGDTVRPMIFVIIAQLCNVILDPFLIFGWWIFPEMGVRGAALATACSTGVSALLAGWYILGDKTAYRIRFRHSIPKFKIIKEIYHVGLPAMLMETTEGIVFALFNHVAAGFGSVVLAALGIAMRIGDLAFMPIIGTAHGMLPIIGFSLGAKLWNRLWGTVKLTAISLAVIMLIATIFLEVFAPQIVSIFDADPVLADIAIPGMRIFFSSLALIGPTIIFVTTFQGLSKGKDAMVLSLARQFIFFVPALFILSHYFGLPGVWISMPVSDTLGMVTAGFWIAREYRQQKKKIGQAEIAVLDQKIKGF